jgi:hypothetical protein
LNTASALRPKNGVVQIDGQTYPSITFIHNKSTIGVTGIPRVSDNVSFNNSLGCTLVSATDLGDGNEQIVLRSNSSTTNNPSQFLELLLRLDP